MEGKNKVHMGKPVDKRKKVVDKKKNSDEHFEGSGQGKTRGIRRMRGVLTASHLCSGKTKSFKRGMALRYELQGSLFRKNH